MGQGVEGEQHFFFFFLVALTSVCFSQKRISSNLFYIED